MTWINQCQCQPPELGSNDWEYSPGNWPEPLWQPPAKVWQCDECGRYWYPFWSTRCLDEYAHPTPFEAEWIWKRGGFKLS